MKVLIADDEYYARKAMAKKVLQADPEAEILGDFENGVQVLEYLEAHPNEADVLLTDVKMPEMDGLYLAQYLFEQESGIEVIIISGYNEFEYARKAISFGVSNYLVKPVQKEELKEALDKISRGRKKYQAKMQNIMSKKALQFLSIEEIATHEDWKKLFLEPVFQRNDNSVFYMAVIQSITREDWTANSKAEKLIQRLKDPFLGEWFYFKRFQENVLLLFGDKTAIVTELNSFVSQAKLLGLGDIQKVLQNLLKEGISVRDLVTIFETLADHAAATRDTDILTEYVRQSLKRAISNKYFPMNETTSVVTLDPSLEQEIMGSVKQTEQGAYLTLDPEKTKRIITSVESEVGKLEKLGKNPIVITSPIVRMYFKRLTEEYYRDLVVVSYNEIDSNVELQSVGMVTA